MSSMRSRAARAAGALVVAVGLTGPLATAQAQDEPLKVVATFSILGDIVANIGGDAIELEVMVGPDGDAHTFEPSPSDIAKLTDADVIVENGVEFETWLDDVYEASDSEAIRVVATDGLALLEIGEGDDHEGEEHEGEGSPEAHHDEDEEHADGASLEADHDEEGEEHEGEEHEHGEQDPHVWQSVQNVIGEVAVIRDALVAADPDAAATYQANADAYLAQLTELDAFITAEVAALPAESRKLVTSHDALGYFADAYGFEIVGTALGSLSTETADPSGGELAALVEQIRAAGVPAIFAENVANIGLMEQIAEDAGVVLAPGLYTDALGPAGSDGETYVEMMRYNATTIVTALGGV